MLVRGLRGGLFGGCAGGRLVHPHGEASTKEAATASVRTTRRKARGEPMGAVREAAVGTMVTMRAVRAVRAVGTVGAMMTVRAVGTVGVVRTIGAMSEAVEAAKAPTGSMHEAAAEATPHSASKRSPSIRPLILSESLSSSGRRDSCHWGLGLYKHTKEVLRLCK